MKIMAQTELSNRGLKILIDGRDWGMAIRRDDLASDPAFAPLDGSEISVDDVRSFLPHCNSLNWEEMTELPGLRRELRAVDEAYSVSLMFPKSQYFTREGVINDFREIFC